MIVRYTCKQCGLVTRVEEGQDYRACACQPADHDVEPETPTEPE